MRKYFKIIGYIILVFWLIGLIIYIIYFAKMAKMLEGIAIAWNVVILLFILVFGPTFGLLLINYSNHAEESEATIASIESKVNSKAIQNLEQEQRAKEIEAQKAKEERIAKERTLREQQRKEAAEKLANVKNAVSENPNDDIESDDIDIGSKVVTNRDLTFAGSDCFYLPKGSKGVVTDMNGMNYEVQFEIDGEIYTKVIFAMSLDKAK